ncbi:substrate-binding domain-containing protein [Nocardioides rubriscoriae]|uniref:substrate-binding domain-containing protein n=1 Tax=Nocardioides rubriscoriae TaxID=642762 RepID=UPI0011DF5781|nr:substrate-binding domain-containing protein [Nocardioides rubriscoriae]
MFHRHTSLAAATVALTVGALVLSHSPAEADFSPQPKDVVSTGSDIIQNSFNFLADGYHELPGYNTAGNRYRFVNFDSSGDAQGRSAFTDPRLLPTTDVGGEKYIKQSDLRLLNPTISLRAGQDLVVRPSGGGAGGRDAILNDNLGWIDVGRSPDPLNANHQNTAQTNLGTKLYRIQIATDRQLIAAATTTNAPATLDAGTILKIYKGEITTWGQIPGYSGANAAETIIPLILPTDAGMWNTFVSNVGKQNPGAGVTSGTLRANPNSIQVQQNDPTAITNLPEAQRRNAIVPFPRGRFRTLNSGYYTQTKELEGTLAVPKTNLYNSDPGHRTPANAGGIQLLDGDSNSDVASPTAPYGGNFAYNAIVRETDLTSTTPWQPGSTLNWVQALFYNPDGPAPFVRTPAGEALLTAAGVTPDYHVFGTDNAEIELG